MSREIDAPATGDGDANAESQQPGRNMGQATVIRAGDRHRNGDGDRNGAGDGDGDASGGRLRKGANIAARLLALGAASLEAVSTLGDDAAAKHIGGQLIRCATGAGANYEEARAAESRADFIHKVSIAAKELRETAYWLNLIHVRSLAKTKHLADEADQLTAILVASARTARKQK